MDVMHQDVERYSEHPLVSFITTVFNGDQYLETCVRWMQRVDWPAIEMVIVNDGSTDGTGAIAARLASEDHRIKVYDFGRLGRSRALNRALSLAQGEVIAIQDVDDYCLPGRLKSTVPLLLADESLAFVAGKALRVASRDEVDQLAATFNGVDRGSVKEIVARDLYMGKNPVVHPSIVFRKKIALSFGGYPDGTCIEDLEFYFSLLAKGRGLLKEDFVTIIYNNPQSAMKGLHNSLQYLRDLVKAQRRARKILNIGGTDRIYDLVPIYLFLRAVMARISPKLFA